MLCDDLDQQSPTFLAPGIGFMEDSFSTDWGWGDGSSSNVSNGGDGSGSNASDGEQWVAAVEASLARLPAAHLLLCGLVPNRPWTSTSPWPGGWGPLT